MLSPRTVPGVAQGCVKVPDIVGPTSCIRFGGVLTKSDWHPGPGTCCHRRTAVRTVWRCRYPWHSRQRQASVAVSRISVREKSSPATLYASAQAQHLRQWVNIRPARGGAHLGEEHVQGCFSAHSARPVEDERLPRDQRDRRIRRGWVVSPHEVHIGRHCKGQRQCREHEGQGNSYCRVLHKLRCSHG